MLTTDSTERSLSVLKTPTQCTDYQPRVSAIHTRHINPTSILVRPTNSNTITKYRGTQTHNYHNQDTHRQTQIQNTQQHDLPKLPIHSTFAFSPTTTHYVEFGAISWKFNILSITAKLKFQSKKSFAYVCDIYNCDYLQHSTFRFNLIDFQLNRDFPFQFRIFYHEIKSQNYRLK